MARAASRAYTLTLVQRAASPADSPSHLDHEIEWQFVVDDPAEAERILRREAAAAGLQLNPLGEQRLVDRYLDTDGWVIHRAGFALRLRDSGGPAEATLKALTEADDGPGAPLRRLEISERLSAAYPLAPLAGLRAGSGPVSRRVRDLAGSAALRPLFTLRTLRRSFALRSGCATLAEIALDHTSILRADGDAAGELRRLEIEVRGAGTPGSVEPLARRLRECGRLRPAERSKFEAGLEATALQPAGTPEPGPGGYDHASSLGEVALAALRRQFAAYLAEEPGTRLGDDVRALHRMRVASRRMRTVIRIFAQALPPELPALRRELRWIANVLGEVRDLDVQLEALDEDEAYAPLRAHVEAARRDARTEMLAALNSPRYEALATGLAEALRGAPDSAGLGAERAILTAPKLLRRAHRRLRRSVRRLAGDASPEGYHRARIRAKRLRYATECVEELYGQPARGLTEALEDVQDVLGRSQDAQIAIARLEQVANADLMPSAETRLAMERLTERATSVLAGRDEAFGAAWSRLRERWTRFDRALDEGAGRAPQGEGRP